MNQYLFAVRNTILCLATCTSLAACQASSSLPSSVEDGLNLAADSKSDGIWGRADHVDYRHNGDMRYTNAGGNARKLQAVSLASDSSYWSISGLTPEIGSYSCADAQASALGIVLNRDGLPRLSSSNGGSCEITVSTANDRLIEGRFLATLADSTGRTIAVKDGGFRFELARVIPDLDSDGLSDADDNCPFAANADQADDDANDIGNVCQPT